MRTYFYLILLLTLFISCQPTVQPKPIASFDFVVGSGGRVEFSNKSENSERYQWIFGDGQASTEQNPIINFRKNGIYTVELSAKSKMGTDDVTKSIEITDIATAGSVMFWTNSSSTSDIEIYVDSGIRGIINKYQSSAPACGADGCVTLTYPGGTYSYYAKSKTHSWSGTFVVKNAVCTPKLLSE